MAVKDVVAKSIIDLVSLSGRRAVVTGGAWGLGRAVARRLAEAGAAVLIADIDIEAASATAVELAAATNSQVIATAMDASDPSSILVAAELAIRQLGGIDVWVNNAGIPSSVDLFDLSDEEFEKVISINLTGTFVGAREASRRMAEAGHGGVIVNVASLAGVRGIAPGQAAYVSSKHGVVGLTRQMAIELAEHDIRVLGIAPGVCLTEKTAFLADIPREQLKQMGIPGIDTTPLGRVGTADDVARVVLFCASDLSMFMTGSTLLVDGGIAA